MLPEAGATELIFLAAIALIVVGPKDLPVLMRKVGQWIAKMRGLAAEFRSSFDELARQSELDELRKEVEALRNTRVPDSLASLHPTFEEVSAGLDPSGFQIGDSHAYSPPGIHEEAVGEPRPSPAAVDPAPEVAPTPKPRARRKPRPKTAMGTEAGTAADGAEPASPAPKPRRKAAAKAPAGAAEAKG